VRDCDECADFRKQLRSDTKALAMMAPVGFLLALKAGIAAKLGLGGAGTAGTAAGTSAGAGVAGGAGASAGAAAVGAGTAASGIGAVGGAVGAKAIAGVVTAAVITAGAVEVKSQVGTDPVAEGESAVTRTIAADPAQGKSAPHKNAPPAVIGEPVEVAQLVKAGTVETAPPAITEPVPVPAPEEEPAAPTAAVDEAGETGGVVPPADANHTAANGGGSAGNSGFEGTVVDVPTKAPPADVTGPAQPDPDTPVSSGQIPSQSPAPEPPAARPDVPAPSVPSPAATTGETRPSPTGDSATTPAPSSPQGN
jgi:hypothetical protein